MGRTGKPERNLLPGFVRAARRKYYFSQLRNTTVLTPPGQVAIIYLLIVWNINIERYDKWLKLFCSYGNTI